MPAAERHWVMPRAEHPGTKSNTGALLEPRRLRLPHSREVLEEEGSGRTRLVTPKRGVDSILIPRYCHQ